MPEQMRIKEKKEPIYETVIEMTGLTSEFTISKVLDHLEYCKRQLKESEAQLNINKHLNDAAEKALPILKDIPAQSAQLVQAYCARVESNQALEELAVECRKTIMKYERRLKDIQEQFGIEMPDYQHLDRDAGKA